MYGEGREEIYAISHRSLVDNSGVALG